MIFILMVVGFIVVMTLAAVWVSASLNEVKGKGEVSFSLRRGLKSGKDEDSF